MKPQVHRTHEKLDQKQVISCDLLIDLIQVGHKLETLLGGRCSVELCIYVVMSLLLCVRMRVVLVQRCT